VKRSFLLYLLFVCWTIVSTGKLYAQDTTDSNSVSIIEDKTVSKDSLNKLLPYLDEVKGDSQTDLNVLYVMAIAASSLISEDLAAIGAGIMAANDLIPFWYAALGAILGILFGDYSLYFLGRYLGRPVLGKAPLRWIIKEESIKNSAIWFDKKGPFILFLSRFIPGSRLPVYLTAGILGTGFWKFTLYFGLTVIIWTPIFVWLSMLAGQEIFYMYEAYDQFAIPFIILFIGLLIGFYKVLPLLLTVAGRRLLWNKLKSFFNNRKSIS
jgi:membrane protein DedA with SNARE-associated domain